MCCNNYVVKIKPGTQPNRSMKSRSKCSNNRESPLAAAEQTARQLWQMLQQKGQRDTCQARNNARMNSTSMAHPSSSRRSTSLPPTMCNPLFLWTTSQHIYMHQKQKNLHIGHTLAHSHQQSYASHISSCLPFWMKPSTAKAQQDWVVNYWLHLMRPNHHKQCFIGTSSSERRPLYCKRAPVSQVGIPVSMVITLSVSASHW